MLMAGTATANGQYASDTKIRVLCFSAESEKQTLRGEMNLMTRIRMTIRGKIPLRSRFPTTCTVSRCADFCNLI